MRYKESLSFSHPVLWLLLLPVTGFLGYGAIRQLVFDQLFGNNPAPDLWLLIFTLLPILVTLLLAFARLNVSIDETGVFYQFFPLQLRQKSILWDEIDAVYVRKYNAMTEFGGWGIRINFSGNKAYNVMGDQGMGMEIVRKNGKKVLFSTRKPQALRQFLDELSSKGKPI